LQLDRSLLTFNPKTHRHYYAGKSLIGVTTALSSVSKGDGLIQWAVNQACDYARANLLVPDLLGDVAGYENAKYLREGDEEDLNIILSGAKYAWKAARSQAASIGTQAHNWIEAYLKGEDPPWPEIEEVKRACEAALEWIKSVKWETIKIEHQICIPELGVGGICDWYARINGVLAVPDWKTSNSLYGTYAYQTAAYLKALEAEFGSKIPHRWLIRIDKNTGSVEPRLLPEDTIEDDYAAFVAAVTLYRREAILKTQWQNIEIGA
jgi:hypothetical protein